MGTRSPAFLDRETMPESDEDVSMSRHPSIALVGYRASGKSTVGKRVAEMLGWEFVDADQALEADGGRTIADLFRVEGEPFFREQEARMVDRLAGVPRTVLATGGGAVLRPENRQALKRSGMVVWLDADVEELARRLGEDAGGRPSLTGRGLVEEVGAVMAERAALYGEVADAIVDTRGLGTEEVAGEIVRIWSMGGPGVPAS